MNNHQNRTKLNTYVYMYKEDVITAEEDWGVYELSPIEDYNISKDYLPLYTTVSLNVYSNI